jgi:hypothetical protein
MKNSYLYPDCPWFISSWGDFYKCAASACGKK